MIKSSSSQGPLWQRHPPVRARLLCQLYTGETMNMKPDDQKLYEQAQKLVQVDALDLSL